LVINDLIIVLGCLHRKVTYPVKDKLLTTSGTSHDKALHKTSAYHVQLSPTNLLLSTLLSNEFNLLKKHQQILFSPSLKWEIQKGLGCRKFQSSRVTENYKENDLNEKEKNPFT